MTRTFILINTLSVKEGYPRVYYCNGCNMVGETVLEMFDQFRERNETAFCLENFENFITVVLGMTQQKREPIEWLWEADEFFIVFFNNEDENPSIRCLVDKEASK